jgi:uncharacterized membrane protein YraQ (UPF0718 family)
VSALILAVYVVIGVAVAVAVAIVMSFFVRRHGESDVPADGWQRTDEVFVDPTTSRRMRVWVDPVDGARHYVADA